jgi:hypothetical protein
MQSSLLMQTCCALKTAIAFLPWVASMFLLYYLEYGQIWTAETPHRGKISVAILIVGLGLSFLAHSWFFRRR